MWTQIAVYKTASRLNEKKRVSELLESLSRRALSTHLEPDLLAKFLVQLYCYCGVFRTRFLSRNIAQSQTHFFQIQISSNDCVTDNERKGKYFLTLNLFFCTPSLYAFETNWRTKINDEASRKPTNLPGRRVLFHRKHIAFGPEQPHRGPEQLRAVQINSWRINTHENNHLRPRQIRPHCNAHQVSPLKYRAILNCRCLPQVIL